VVRFVVAPSGVVDEAKALESEVPSEVADCLARAFSELRFAESAGGPIRISYPFRLTRSGLVPASPGAHPNQRTPGQGPSAPTDAQARAEAELYRRFLAGLSQPAVASAPSAAPAEPEPVVAPALSLPSRPGCEGADPLCADL